MNAKAALKTCLACAFVLPLLAFRGNRRKVVLYYHAVTDGEAENFARQMRFLARRFATAAPSDILGAAAEGKPLAAITFDDAFACLERNALPVLRELGIPAAICVPAGNLGAAPRWDLEASCPDSSETVMDGKALARVHEAGFELFSHTMSHPRLDSLGEGRLREELARSKEILDGMIPTPVRGISYPHGAVNPAVLRETARAGYGLGYTITPGLVGPETNPLAIPRTEAFPSDGLFVFWLKASGAFSYLGAFRRGKA